MRLHQNPAFITRVDEWKLRGRPKQNGMDWVASKWIEEFPQHDAFLTTLSLRNLGNLDRALVREFTHECINEEKWIEAFLTVMIWGFGPDARGPFRTKRILEQKNSMRILETCITSLRNNDVEGAYKALIDNGPKYLGPAFGTKFIYFASDSIEGNQPLILDSLVSIGLKEWGNITFNPLSAKANDYMRYLEYMNEEAIKFSISPEDLEMILFTETARLKGNQSWANRQSNSHQSAEELFCWGLLFAAELMLRMPNLKLTYTQPGGGQYECLTLKSKSQESIYEFDLNLVGGIHISGKHALRIDWDDLIQRGAASSAELLMRVVGADPEIDLTRASVQAVTLRALADIAIQNLSNSNWKIENVQVDNSVYGISIRFDLLEPFFKDSKVLVSSDKEFAKQLDSLWVISIDSVPSHLINLNNGTSTRTDGTVLVWTWPN